MRFCSRLRGTSLMEALVACFMVLLLLSIVSFTVRGYRQVLGQLHSHDESMDVALALQSVGREASSSVEITGASPLTLRRVDPSNPNRLPTQLSPIPAPVPDTWEPLDPAWMEVVVFTLVGSDLRRQVTFADNTGSQATLASGLEGFSATLGAQGLLELTARLPGPRLVKTAVKFQ